MLFVYMIHIIFFWFFNIVWTRDSRRYLASQTNEVKPAALNAIYFPGDNVRIRRLFLREARRVCDRDKVTKQQDERRDERRRWRERTIDRELNFLHTQAEVLNKRHTESSLKREAQILISLLQRAGLKSLFFLNG